QLSIALRVECGQPAKESNDSPDFILPGIAAPTRHSCVLKAVFDDPVEFFGLPGWGLGFESGRRGQHSEEDRIERRTGTCVAGKTSALIVSRPEGNQRKIVEVRVWLRFRVDLDRAAHAEFEKPVHPGRMAAACRNVVKPEPRHEQRHWYSE